MTTSFRRALQVVEPSSDGSCSTTSRGFYLREFRRALDLTVGSAARVLHLGVAEASGLEMGEYTFADEVTWIRLELELAIAAGPGWCGEEASTHLRSARTMLRMAESSTSEEVGLRAGAMNDVARAANAQLLTVKRGVLCCLASRIALALQRPDDAVYLAGTGQDGDVGPVPTWLAASLQAVIDKAAILNAAETS